MARSLSIVINVPIASDPRTAYVVNLRRWLSTGLWAEWTSVLNFTIGSDMASRVRTSSNDGGRKYIPVRVGPLFHETFYQVTVQYQRGSALSSPSAIRTTKTLKLGEPRWLKVY